MPKSTVVETAVCDLCGAAVRVGSLFCYNCGGSLSKRSEPAPIQPPADPIMARSGESANGAFTAADVEPAQRKVERSERRKVRTANRQPAEIVWEPREGVSWLFVAATLVLVVIAFGIVIAAFYLR